MHYLPSIFIIPCSTFDIQFPLSTHGPPHAPPKRIKSLKSPNHPVSLATSHTPDMVVDVLVVGAHVAEVGVQAPRAVGAVGVSTRRPVIGRLHIRERVTSGQSRTISAIIKQTVKLPQIGQAPIASAGTVSEPTTPISQVVALTQGLGPRSLAKAIGVLQPDQSSKIVSHCPIPVICKPWIRPGHTLL